MSLVGWPLQILATAGLIIAVAGLAGAWLRLPGWWRVVRVLGVIVCQLLLMFAVGLWVNRTDDFYPSWAALFGDNPPKITTQQQPEALLSSWLSGQRTRGARYGLSFEWRGDEDTTWKLRAPTVVFLPKEYFVSAKTALPVVFVLVGPDQSKTAATWTPSRLGRLVASSPAVIVLVQPLPRGPSSQFVAQLPTQLIADLRTTAIGWGIVGVGGAIPAALNVFNADPAHFGALALMSTSPATVAAKARAVAVAHSRPLLITALTGVALTLRWMYGQLPPALRAPLVVAPAGATHNS